MSFIIFSFSLLLCYIPTRRHHGAIVTIVGVVSNIFLIVFFLEKLRLRIPKVGIIRNEIYFFVFYQCVNSGESVTNLTSSPLGFIQL